MSSMIPSARPTVTPIAITLFYDNCFVLAMFKRTDGQKTHVKAVITTGRDCGSAE